MPAKPVTPLIREKLALRYNLDKNNTPGLLLALTHTATPIVKGFLQRLQLQGTLQHYSKEELDLEALSAAACTATLLFDGLCNCGDPEIAARLRREPGCCGIEHSLNGWDYKHDRLERFLLRCLLAHSAPAAKVPDSRIDTPENLRMTACILTARGLRDRPRGMLLCQIHPLLRMLTVPVCTRCNSMISLNNSCCCVKSGAHPLPMVNRLQPRLICEDHYERWQSVLAWKIVPPDSPSHPCRHQANSEMGGTLVMGRLLPHNEHASATPNQRKKKKPRQSNPPCPACGKPLAGKTTRVDLPATLHGRVQVTTESHPPHSAAHSDLTYREHPPTPDNQPTIDPDDVMYDEPYSHLTTLDAITLDSTTAASQREPNDLLQLLELLLQHRTCPRNTPLELSDELKRLQTDLQNLHERRDPNHPESLELHQLLNLLIQKLRACSPALTTLIERTFRGS